MAFRNPGQRKHATLEEQQQQKQHDASRFKYYMSDSSHTSAGLRPKLKEKKLKKPTMDLRGETTLDRPGKSFPKAARFGSPRKSAEMADVFYIPRGSMADRLQAPALYDSRSPRFPVDSKGPNVGPGQYFQQPRDISPPVTSRSRGKRRSRSGRSTAASNAVASRSSSPSGHIERPSSSFASTSLQRPPTRDIDAEFGTAEGGMQPVVPAAPMKSWVSRHIAVTTSVSPRGHSFGRSNRFPVELRPESPDVGVYWSPNVWKGKKSYHRNWKDIS